MDHRVIIYCRISPLFFFLLCLVSVPVSLGVYERTPTEDEIKKMTHEELDAYIQHKKERDPLVTVSENTPYIQKIAQNEKKPVSSLVKRLNAPEIKLEGERTFRGHRRKKNWRGKPTDTFEEGTVCSLWVSGKKWKITFSNEGTEPVELELGEKPHYFELTFLSKDGKTSKAYWGVPENNYFEDSADHCDGFLNPGDSCDAAERFTGEGLIKLFHGQNIKQIDLQCYGEYFRLAPE